jgi:flagellar motor switch protein FliN/FliY
MSDIISQEQLDALLNQAGMGTGDTAAAAPARNYEALMAAFALFKEKATSVMGSVFSRGVNLEVSECSAADASYLGKIVTDPVLMTAMTMGGAIEGTVSVFLSTKTAAMLADLMLMGDGKAEYNADHKDALSELFNQIFGAYVTALCQKTGGQVTSEGISVSEFDFAQPDFPFSGSDMAVISIKVDNLPDTVMAAVVPAALGDSLIEKFGPPAAEPVSETSQSGGFGISGAELDELSHVTGDSGSDAVFRAPGGMSGPVDKSVEMLLDIELDVSIELGRSNLSVKRVLDLSPGSIVELDRMAGEPVDLLVNNKVVAKGEVVVVDENFGIRIVSLVSPEERIRSLR